MSANELYFAMWPSITVQLASASWYDSNSHGLNLYLPSISISHVTVIKYESKTNVLISIYRSSIHISIHPFIYCYYNIHRYRYVDIYKLYIISLTWHLVRIIIDSTIRRILSRLYAQAHKLFYHVRINHYRDYSDPSLTTDGTPNSHVSFKQNDGVI